VIGGTGSGSRPPGAGLIGGAGGAGLPGFWLLPLIVALVGGSGGFALVVARRRRREPVTVVVTEAAAALLAPPVADPLKEAHLPRWRRPSLQAARTRNTSRWAMEPTWQLAFSTEAAVGAERRRVRYRLVRLSDAPDEIRSTEIGQLEAQDEVEVLNRHAGFILVRTPLGTEGWVHRTTLGPPIGADGQELTDGQVADTTGESACDQSSG
jgi:SH3 domain-containing protein